MIRPQPVRRPRSWRRPVARLARWLTGAHSFGYTVAELHDHGKEEA